MNMPCISSSTYLALFWSLRYGWFFWRRRHRYTRDVTLDTAEPDDRFTVTVINRSRRTASIQKLILNVYSADLNRKTQGELKERIEMSSQVDERLDPGGSIEFDLHRRQESRDQPSPLHFRDVVADLDDLGVELAELSVFVIDNNNQTYQSNAVRIPVYQLVASNGDNGLGKPGVMAW